MKKLFTLFAFIASLLCLAQAPEGFNYQATVRNSAGDLMASQNVYFKFNLMLNSQTALPVYSETHYVPTDDLGQVNLIIGTGTPSIGTFSAINWGSGNYYLGIEMNTGNAYVAMGTTQLLSVPYALYANSAGNGQATIPNLAAVLAVNNNGNNLQIKNVAEPTDPEDVVNKAYVDESDSQLQNQITNLQAQIIALQNASVAPLPNVTIGTQIWSSSNLNVATYRDGTPIPEVTDPTAWANLTTGAWCYYNNNATYGLIYGKLYNWYALAGIHDNDPNTPNKIIAPQGWHIPSNTEWTVLMTFLGGESLAGGNMKETGGSQTDGYSWNYNTGGANLSGFSAKPASWRYTESSGTYFGGNYPVKMAAFWWTSTESESEFASLRSIQASSDTLYLQALSHRKSNGLSLRCVKD